MALIAVGLLSDIAGGASAHEPANPQPTPSGTITGDVPEVIVAYDAGGSTIAQGRPGGRGTWSCHYYGIHSVDPSALPGAFDYATGPIRPAEDEVVGLECTDGTGRTQYSELVTWTAATPFGPIDAAGRAAEEARRQLPLPDPVPAMSPPVGTAHVTGIPSWFWIPAPGPLTASATLVGVTATVTATATSVVVDPGDGSAAISCPGGGTPYDPSRPASDQRTTCEHTFQRRSHLQPGGTWPATVTVTWHLTWTSTTGAGGDLGSVTRSTTTPIEVVQAEAVIR